MWFLVFGTAVAQPYLLHDATEDAADAALARHDAAQPYVGVALANLRAAPPYIHAGLGRVWSCGGRSPDDTAEQWVARAEWALLARDDRAGALAMVHRARESALCEWPLPVAALTRSWFLAGVVAELEGQRDAAVDAFRVARRLDPALQWDADVPPDGRDAFDVAGAPSVAATRLSLIPDQGSRQIEVDGREPPGSGRLVLSPGVHYLTLEGPKVSVAIDLDRGEEATLVLPALLPAVTEWPADPARWPALGVVLRGAEGEDGRPWLVVSDDEVWSAPSAVGPYRALPARAPAPGWVRSARLAAAVGLAGMAACGTGELLARKDVTEAEDDPYPVYAAALDRLHRWDVCFAASSGVTATGLGIWWTGPLLARRGAR